MIAQEKSKKEGKNDSTLSLRGGFYVIFWETFFSKNAQNALFERCFLCNLLGNFFSKNAQNETFAPVGCSLGLWHKNTNGIKKV